MKLKTNNRFSKWLFKLACKFGYTAFYLEPKTVYITPRNFIKVSHVVKIPKSDYIGDIKGYINRTVCYKLIEEEVFRQNIKFTNWYNPSDCTEIIKAELYILNKKGLEDFYERY